MVFTWWGLIILFIATWVITRHFIIAVLVTGFMWWWDPVWVGWDITGWIKGVFSWCSAKIDEGWSFIMAHPKPFLWWYLIGIGASLYFPMKYWDGMNRWDRRRIVIGTPFYALLGPLALIRFPV